MDEAAVGVEADPSDATLDGEIAYFDGGHPFDVDIGGLPPQMVGPAMTAAGFGSVSRDDHHGLPKMATDQREMSGEPRVDIVGFIRSPASHQLAQQMELRRQEIPSRTHTEQPKLLGLVVGVKNDRRRFGP